MNDSLWGLLYILSICIAGYIIAGKDALIPCLFYTGIILASKLNQ